MYYQHPSKICYDYLFYNSDIISNTRFSIPCVSFHLVGITLFIQYLVLRKFNLKLLKRLQVISQVLHLRVRSVTLVLHIFVLSCTNVGVWLRSVTQYVCWLKEIPGRPLYVSTLFCSYDVDPYYPVTT